jgi:hypothetical protein
MFFLLVNLCQFKGVIAVWKDFLKEMFLLNVYNKI